MGLNNFLFKLVIFVQFFVAVYSETSGEPTAAALKSPYHIDDQSVYFGTLFRFILPISTFHSTNIKSIDVHVLPKTPLPTWLKFDQKSRELIGLPGYNDIGNVHIKVIASYYDKDELSSHIFKIKVLNSDPTNLADKLSLKNISENSFEENCISQHPYLVTILFNMNYNFLKLQDKIKFYLTSKNELNLSEDDLKIGTARDFYQKTQCEKQSSAPQLQTTDAERLALRVVIKNCFQICKNSETIFAKVKELEFGGPKAVHWIAYTYDNKPDDPWKTGSSENWEKVPQTSFYGVSDITNADFSQQKPTTNFQAQINWDFMFEENIAMYVGQVLTIPISPYLVQNEKVYLLTTAERHSGTTFGEAKTQWIQLINNSTNPGNSRITIVGLESEKGTHTFCLKPSLLKTECIKFQVTIQATKRELNHALSINFDFPMRSFDRSMEVKLNLINCILRTAFPDEEKRRYENILLSNYFTPIDSSLLLNISLGNYYASLCTVDNEINKIYSYFSEGDASNEPSAFFKDSCEDFTPERVSIQYFGPCSLDNNAIVQLPQEHGGAGENVIKISVSTILLISILSFVILVVIGISVIFIIMHFTVRKSESIYCADSFCEMRAKNMPTIFPHEIQDHNSSRSSSPSRLYSLVPQSSTKSSLAQPSLLQPSTRIITSTRSPDAFQSRNSFGSGSNRSDPNGVVIQPAIFDSITEVVRPTPSTSYTSTVIAKPNSPIIITTGTPDILINSANNHQKIAPNQQELYDVPNIDSVLRFGSFHQPRIESSASSGYNTGTVARTHTGHSPYPNQTRNAHEEYQSGDDSATAAILAPKIRLSSDNSDDKEFLQFRMPSPLPTQALLLQAQADLDKHKVMSHRFC